MANCNIPSTVTFIFGALALLFTIIGLTTNFWSELDNAGVILSSGIMKANWGLWKYCDNTGASEDDPFETDCKRYDDLQIDYDVPTYWRATQALEVIGCVGSLGAIIIWIFWIACATPRTSLFIKVATVIFAGLSTLFQALAVIVWGTQREYPISDNRDDRLSWSWAMAILGISFQLPMMIAVWLSNLHVDVKLRQHTIGHTSTISRY